MNVWGKNDLHESDSSSSTSEAVEPDRHHHSTVSMQSSTDHLNVDKNSVWRNLSVPSEPLPSRKDRFSNKKLRKSKSTSQNEIKFNANETAANPERKGSRTATRPTGLSVKTTTVFNSSKNHVAGLDTGSNGAPFDGHVAHTSEEIVVPVAKKKTVFMHARTSVRESQEPVQAVVPSPINSELPAVKKTVVFKALGGNNASGATNGANFMPDQGVTQEPTGFVSSSNKKRKVFKASKSISLDNEGNNPNASFVIEEPSLQIIPLDDQEPALDVPLMEEMEQVLQSLKWATPDETADHVPVYKLAPPYEEGFTSDQLEITDFVAEPQMAMNDESSIDHSEAFFRESEPNKFPQGESPKGKKQKRSMALRVKARGKLPIGLSLEGDVLIGTEIERIKNGFRARTLMVKPLQGIRFPIPEEKIDEFTDMLREVVQIARWKHRKVVLSAPVEYVMLRHITVQPMKQKVLKIAIQSEVKNNLSFPFDDPHFDYKVLEDTCVKDPNDSNLDVVIVAAPGKDLEQYANCVRLAGLVPIRLEPGILSLQRLIQSSGESIDPKLLYAIVHLRYDGAEFGFFEGGTLLFMRHMEMRPDSYPHDFFSGDEDASVLTTDALESGTQNDGLPGVIDDFEISAYSADLSSEIDRSLNFVHYNLIKNEMKVQLVYLVCAMLDTEPIVEAMQERMELEIRVIESQLVFERPEQSHVEGATPWTVEGAHYAVTALGLALPEVNG